MTDGPDRAVQAAEATEEPEQGPSRSDSSYSGFDASQAPVAEVVVDGPGTTPPGRGSSEGSRGARGGKRLSQLDGFSPGWFVGPVPRATVDSCLKNRASPGSYVVRESEREAGAYTLAVRFVEHKIKQSDSSSKLCKTANVEYRIAASRPFPSHTLYTDVG